MTLTKDAPSEFYHLFVDSAFSLFTLKASVRRGKGHAAFFLPLAANSDSKLMLHVGIDDYPKHDGHLYISSPDFYLTEHQTI